MVDRRHECRKKNDIVQPARPGDGDQIKLTVNGDMVTLGEPLYRTHDGRLVDGQHPDGRWLYGEKGTRVPRVELEYYGLLRATPRRGHTRHRRPSESKGDS